MADEKSTLQLAKYIINFFAKDKKEEKSKAKTTIDELAEYFAKRVTLITEKNEKIEQRKKDSFFEEKPRESNPIDDISAVENKIDGLDTEFADKKIKDLKELFELIKKAKENVDKSDLSKEQKDAFNADFEKQKGYETERLQKEKYADDIAAAKDNASKLRDIEIKKKEDIINAQKAASIAQEEIDKEQKKLKKLNHEKDVETFLEHTKKLTDIQKGAAAVNGQISAWENQDLEEKKKGFDQEKEDLKNHLEAGLISKQQYNEKVAEIDKNYATKKAELDRKQAERNKALAIFEITISTAQAIMKIWATSGLLAIGAQVYAAAAGAIQLAAAMNAPLPPKAAKGGKIFGAAHAQGGVMIEAEGGEYIINKKSAARFDGLLAAINGNNVGRFNTPFGDGGFGYRTLMRTTAAGGINPEMMTSAVAAGMKQANIYVSVEDINKMENKVAVTDTAIY